MMSDCHNDSDYDPITCVTAGELRRNQKACISSDIPSSAWIHRNDWEFKADEVYENKNVPISNDRRFMVKGKIIIKVPFDR